MAISEGVTEQKDNSIVTEIFFVVVDVTVCVREYVSLCLYFYDFLLSVQIFLYCIVDIIFCLIAYSPWLSGATRLPYYMNIIKVH